MTHILGTKLFRMVIIGEIPPGIPTDLHAQAAVMNAISYNAAIAPLVKHAQCDIVSESDVLPRNPQ